MPKYQTNGYHYFGCDVRAVNSSDDGRFGGRRADRSQGPVRPAIGLHTYAAHPIKAGFAESYVHPGGHATGNVMNAAGAKETLIQKRMNLFKELVPD
jgi:hypothetical protein